MNKTALLMLCTSLGFVAEAGAQSGNNNPYQGTPRYGAGAAVSDSAVFELLGRLEQLQSEVQQLRGLVEEQAQTIADLERKQGNMYTDLDERLQLLAPGGQPAQAGTAATPQVASDASQAAQAAVAPAATQAPSQAAVQPEAGASQAPQASQSPAPKAGEQERYQQAYEALRNGHNTQAIKMFEALAADYPNGELGDNAQYWLGEAYKINREFDKAKAAFNKVVSQYPNSSKVADALLKLGYIELDQQNPAKARDYLTRVATSYPGTTAAHLAAKKLAQMPQ
ncbi:MAG: tol-pal system protein YbgF [Methylomonas sp.]|nr:tol-pal system protein YbgF [Methylomonas sp.]